MSIPVFLSRLHFPITALGPGRRVGVWFQGCSIRCRGCISADTWGFGRGATTVGSVMEVLNPWLALADGVTISGGEPFDQTEALMALLCQIKAQFPGDVLVYTGYPYKKVAQALRRRSGLIDALITDPYDESAGQTLPLRGSDNQRLHFLTSLGLNRFQNYENGAPESRTKLDVMFDDEGEVWFAGIPGHGDFARLKAALMAHGHAVTTSVDAHNYSVAKGD